MMKKALLATTLCLCAFVVSFAARPIHVRLKLAQDKTSHEVGRDHYGATEGNKWPAYIVEAANQDKKNFKGGDDVEIPLLRWKTVEIKPEWLKPNGKTSASSVETLDKLKVEAATGMTWIELKKKNPSLEAE